MCNRKLICRFVVVSLLVVLLGLSGCSSLTYYGQSVVGHSKLMLAREPVIKLIPNASQPLKSRLLLSQELRRFASEELGLPNSKSYTSYVALDRDYPVWNVVAAPELSLNAKQWCYPVIGCASYRGYFKRQAAVRFANKLERQGFETIVAGASAYSTLGWFSDPLLPSMMRFGDVNLADILFHELAHQKLYVNGDSNFNEAFATVVGEVGAMRWLTQTRPDKLEQYKDGLRARDQFYELVENAKRALIEVYSAKHSIDEQRQAKQVILATFTSDYDALKVEQWGGRPLFDHWFEQELNNARFVAFATYRDKTSDLLALLERCDDDFARFYDAFAKPVKVMGKVKIPTNCD